MDPEPPQPANLRELRILVLHNRDFAPDAPTTGDAGDGEYPADLQDVSRADVANAAQRIARALVSRGHFVEVQGIDRDDLGDLLAQLRHDPPDLVFNLVESLAGDDRHAMLIPPLLELLGIPYTGANPLTMAVTTRKEHAKSLLEAAAIPTPPGVLLPAQRQSAAKDLAAVQSIGYPLFLKLAEHSGSVGVSARSIVSSGDELLSQLDFLRTRYGGPILAERFIEGRELQVAMLGNDPLRLLPLREIDFSAMPELPSVVSERSKWDVDSPEYTLIRSGPAAPIADAVRARIDEVARRAFTQLEFHDYGRIDIRLSSSGIPYVIDCNANCDLSDSAGYAEAGQMAGLSYDRLIEEIALSAIKRSAHVTAHRQRSDSSGSHHSVGAAKRPSSAA